METGASAQLWGPRRDLVNPRNGVCWINCSQSMGLDCFKERFRKKRRDFVFIALVSENWGRSSLSHVVFPLVALEILRVDWILYGVYFFRCVWSHGNLLLWRPYSTSKYPGICFGGFLLFCNFSRQKCAFICFVILTSIFCLTGYFNMSNNC